MGKRARPLRRCVAVAVVLSLAAGHATRAQPAPGPRVGVAPPAQETPEPELSGGLILAADRSATLRLNQARALLAEERYSEATQILGLLLEHPEDFFYQPDPKSPVHKSVKSEAERLIGSLPRQGLAAYRLLFEAQAHEQLRQAVDTGDKSALARLARQFFHTEAGGEATWLLARHYLDQGRALGAAMCLDRLRQSPTTPDAWRAALTLQSAAAWRAAGQLAESEQLAAEAQSEPGFARLAAIVEGRQSADESPLRVLTRLLAAYDAAKAPAAAGDEGWRMFRGTPDRNTESAGGAPLLSAIWKLRLANEPAVEKLLEQLATGYTAQHIPLLPAAHPLVVNDVVLARNANTLVAADFFTGKKLWEVPVEETIESYLEQTGRSSQVNAQSVLAGLEQRVWDDATFGTLASDGTRVFLLEDLRLMPGTLPTDLNARRVAINLQQRMMRSLPESNRLAAFDVVTGKLQWELGGPAGMRSLPLAETFFLGPPLPLAGELYVLAEQNSEIRLLALESATGELDWSQPLSVLERGIGQEPLRRLAGVSPSYCDGVLVCPTAAGGIVAIDLTARALLWGYRYRNLADDAAQGGMPFNLRPAMAQAGQRRGTVHRWMDASATIVAGRVLLTPVESDELHCLDLKTGALLWKRPRDDGLYLAAVEGGRIVVVGAKRALLLDLATGRPVDAGAPLPGEAQPSGRGFLTGSRYYLPLSNGQIAVLDVELGRFVDSIRSRRQASPPGNLVCHRGTILSQSSRAVEAYYQQSALEERLGRILKENPRDARALTLRGELALGQGRPEAALVDLREAVQQSQDAYARRLLAETLLDGLERDFARFESESGSLTELLDTPGQRTRLAQLLARGRQAQGRTREALQQYLAIAETDEPHALLTIEPGYEVRVDRWVRAGLASLAESASAADAELLAQTVAQRYATAVQAGNAASFERFLDFFGDAPQAAAARTRLAALLGPQQTLAVERLLGDVARRGTPTEQARAVRSLARLCAEQGAPAEAAEYYRLLATTYAKVELEPGRTGGDVVAALKSTDPAAQAVGGRRSWPPHLLGIDRLAQGGPVLRFFDVPQWRRAPGMAEELSLSIDQRGQYLLARDGQGRERFRALLTEPAERLVPGLEVALSHAQIAGRLVLVSMGDEIVAVDASSQPGQRLARIVWRYSLVDTLPGWNDGAGIRAGVEERPWGQQRMTAVDTLSARPIGAMGPITRDVVALERSRRLVGLDPLTGATLWSRADLPSGSELFGDDELLLVAGPDESKATVLRMADGHRLGARALPPRAARMTHSGRRILCWTSRGAGTALQLFDPWTQAVLWSEELSAGAKAALIGGGDEVAVVEPQGRVRVFDVASGAARVDAEVEPSTRLHQVLVQRSREQYVIVGNQQVVNDGRIFVVPIPGGQENPVLSGQLWAFRRSDGKRLWSRKLERQALLLTQPSETPALVFASRLFDRSPQPMGADGAGHQAHFLVLDRRTGQTLLDERAPGNVASYELTGVPESDAVTLRFMRTALQFRFGDAPPGKATATLEPQEPDAASAE